MIIDGHDEITGEEIDWDCDTRDELTDLKGGMNMEKETKKCSFCGKEYTKKDIVKIASGKYLCINCFDKGAADSGF